MRGAESVPHHGTMASYSVMRALDPPIKLEAAGTAWLVAVPFARLGVGEVQRSARDCCTSCTLLGKRGVWS